MDTSSSVTEAKVAVVTVNYRTPELTLACMRSLLPERVTLPQLRAVVVDGGSGDGSAEMLAGHLASSDFADWVQFLPLEINGGFGWANNQAILRLLQSDHPPDYIHLLNPDTRIDPGAVAALLRLMQAKPRCGAAGSLLLDEKGGTTGSAFRFPSTARELIRGSQTAALGNLLGVPNLMLPQSHEPIEADWVAGASVMLRSEALRETGLFDDGFFLYFEEVELMWRMHSRGWSVWHEPHSRVTHIAGAATGVREQMGGEHLLDARPAYWYESQRRFFVSTQGYMAAVMATLAWTLGHFFWQLRKLSGLRSAKIEVSQETRDRWRLGFPPRRRDRRRAVVGVDTCPGVEPAWMDDPS